VRIGPGQRAVLAAAIAGWALVAPRPSGASGADEAEALVRTVYYEGLPPDAAAALDDAGIARLGEMLADPLEAATHGNIVDALGWSGHPGAFPLLQRYAAEAPEGEVDRDAFRARSRLPQAMGRLARSDARALAWLLAEEKRSDAPGWWFRQQRGAHLSTLLQEQLLTGLALSGAPAARAAIEAQLAAPGQDVAAQRRRRAAAFARELHARTVADERGPR